jgi:hypothetical protein
MAAVYVFALPQVDIAASHDVLIDSNPSSETFVITNKSWYPLWDVRPFVGVCEIQIQFGNPDTARDKTLSKPLGKCDGSLYNRRVGGNKWNKRSLGIGEQYPIALSDAIWIWMPVPSYSISIIVQYRPWFIPCTLTKETKYETRELADGNLHWFPNGDYHSLHCF